MIEGNRVTIGASVGIAIGDPGPRLRRFDGPQRRPRALRRQGRRARQALLLRSRRCTARRPTAKCSKTTCARRSTATNCGSPTSRSSAPRARKSRASRRWCAGTTRRAAPIGPDKFIPLAEECGMIGKIGEFVLHTALAEAATWPDSVRIAVNLSPIQFNDPVDRRHRRRRARRDQDSAPSGSSSRSPKACSWPTATPPT